jgi:hypothetical protein
MAVVLSLAFLGILGILEVTLALCWWTTWWRSEYLRKKKEV